MSERICYLETASRGALITGVRIVGAHIDDRWETEPATNADDALGAIDEAARWIRERLKALPGSSKSIDALCLDSGGSVCAWTKPEDADAQMIRAAIDELDTQGGEDGLEAHHQSTLGERFPALPMELDFQSLSADLSSEGARRAVLGLPDTPARLLIDKLDSWGIRVARAETVWHQIARAWDPSSSHRSSVRDSSRVVATSEPLCASIVVDHDRARAMWSWSRRGALLAAGSVRLCPAERALDQDTIGRLITDWLGWSSQLGVAPGRIVVVTHEESVTEGVVSRLDARWPSATTNLITDPDPLLTTLRANTGIGGAEGLDSGIDPLTHRAGRAHRSMYRWGAGALAACAAALAIGAWSLHSESAEVQSRAGAIRTETTAMLTEFDPEVALSALPVLVLEDRRNTLLNRAAPVDVNAGKPIVEALETISLVVGMPGIEIESIDMTIFSVKVTVKCDELATAEQISEALRTIGGSDLRWSSPDLSNRGSQIRAVYSARWESEPST